MLKTTAVAHLYETEREKVERVRPWTAVESHVWLAHAVYLNTKCTGTLINYQTDLWPI
jgi:hypothetical protein